MLLRNELQYVIVITTPTTLLEISKVVTKHDFSKATEHDFSKAAEHDFSKIAEHISSKSLMNFATFFLQIAEHVSSKSPMYFATLFHQIAEHFPPNLQGISLISEQHTFFFVPFGEDPVSDPSLHVLRAPRSALWVVGCGSFVTPVHPTRPRAPCSMLWTMG